ncbi:MAG: hypothetical protein QM655_09290 [Nocardioidaceae bacterium]
MRTTRFLGFFVALAVALGLAVVPATAQAATITTKVSIKAPKAVYYNKYFHIKGQLTATDGTESGYLPSEQVTLMAKASGKTEWTTVTTRYTNSTAGIYDFYVKAGSKTVYQVKFAGDGSYPASSSSTATVKVRRDITEKSKRLSARNFKFYGKVAPSYGKKKITLQKKVGKHWKKVTAKKTNKAGKWSFTVRALRHRGKIKFRTAVPAQGGYLGDVSRVLIITTY